MNDEAAPFDDLISRHFDDAASSAETAALAERLTNDRAVALQFVRTARIDALMEAMAPAKRRAPVLRHRVAFGTAAAVIAVGAAAAIFRPGKPAGTDIRPQIVLNTGDLLIDRKPLPPGVNLRIVRNFAAATAVPPASLDFLLSNFYVHADPNGLRVPEALRALEQAIDEANLLGRRELAALSFTAGASMIPPATKEDGTLPEIQYKLRFGYEADPRIYSPLRPPFAIGEYLKVCGLYREVTQEPGGVRYASPPAAIAPDHPTPLKTRLTTRTFRINPELFRFAVEKDDLRRMLLLRFGVALSNQEVLGYSDDLSVFSINSSEAKLDRIQQVLDICTGRKSVQHCINTKFVVCRPELLPPKFDHGTGMLLNAWEFHSFDQLLSLNRDAELADAPVVIVRPGQASEIQLLCELPGREAVEPLQSDWFGLRQEMQTACVGETIQISGMVDFGVPAATGMLPLTEFVGNTGALLPYGAESVMHERTGFDLWIPNGYTAVFTLDVSTGDRVALACITARQIEPDGVSK
jgi:hypothetical protein